MNLLSLKEKIVLGTVQLGLPYGINNLTGKPSEKEAFKILDFAFENNIRTLDSADGYGEALNVIGKHRSISCKNFDIINKFKVDGISLSEKIQKSLDLLRSNSLSCYMYHDFADYESKQVRPELASLKKRGIILRIGISLYTIDQLRAVIDDEEIDVVQLPVNILDLNSQKQELLRLAKKRGKEIHARSIFLQGLLLKTPESLTGKLAALQPYINKLKSLCKTHGVDIKSAALNFAAHKDFLDRLVIGVEHVEQLRENLALLDPAFHENVFGSIEVKSGDAHLLNPVNWKE